MESKISTNSPESYQYFDDSTYQIEEGDINGIFNRINKLEIALNKINTGANNNISERDVNNIKNTTKDGKVAINQDILNIKHDDYPKQLIRFYFIYQYFYSTPSIFSINEYYECMAYFNGKIPDYLTCAIMSKSSLYSPSPQLYGKNLDYSNYYYELSVRYLNTSLGKNLINIYMLHALSILSWVDESLNRQFSRFSRVATSTKLTHILGLDNCYYKSNFSSINISEFSIKKLLGFIKINNHEISKVFSIPKINICSELEFDCYQMRNEENNTSLNDLSFKLLPKEYYFTFKAQKYYLNLKFTHINSLEGDLYSKSAAYSFQQCYKLIRHINEKYCNLPRTVRYSKNCLKSEEIEKYPLLIRILRLHQLVLKQISVIFGLLVKIIHKSSTYEIIFLSQNIEIFFERVLDLLRDQQFSTKSSRNDVHLDSPCFYYYGTLLLDLMENLNQELSKRNCSSLKNSFETASAGFNSFTTLITCFRNNWEGSDKILNSFTNRYESILPIK
jgi:hypothetical protein